MQLQAIQYLPRKLIALDWCYLLRWFILGPFTGACVGIVQTTAAVLIWMEYGEPGDFYFRGWEWIKTSYVMFIIGGGIVGLAYGAVLRIFERLCHRRVRLSVAIPSVLVVAFIAAYIIVDNEFRQQQLGGALVEQLIAIGFGLVISIATAHPSPSQKSTTASGDVDA